MASTKDQNILMTEYLQDQTIIIADTSGVSRTRLKKCLIDLGAKQQNIKSCGSYEEAEQEMNKHNPRVVLSEYSLGKKSGFDLLREYRENNSDSNKSLFILITSNGGQSLVARAAEEDIDSFILKPYTADSLKKTLTKTAMDKIYPSPYAQKIEAGKSLLFAGDYEQATAIFKEAVPLNQSPTLAYFYLGQAEMMKEALEEAKEKYEEGLSYNKIHYKCLVSLFDLLYEQQKWDEAYNVVRKLAKYFPANPHRLGTVLRLAIKTDNVTDISDYYKIFKDIDERPAFLIKNMSAALIINGKYLLGKKKEQEGLICFEQAAVVSQGDKQFLLYIIEYLVFYGHLSEIPSFIGRFTGDDRKSQEFEIVQFLLNSGSMQPIQIIQQAQNFLQKKIESVGIYLLLLQNLTAQDRFEEALHYCSIVQKKWPEKEYFFDLIKNKLPQPEKDAS